MSEIHEAKRCYYEPRRIMRVAFAVLTSSAWSAPRVVLKVLMLVAAKYSRISEGSAPSSNARSAGLSAGSVLVMLDLDREIPGTLYTAGR